MLLNRQGPKPNGRAADGEVIGEEQQVIAQPCKVQLVNQASPRTDCPKSDGQIHGRDNPHHAAQVKGLKLDRAIAHKFAPQKRCDEIAAEKKEQGHAKLARNHSLHTNMRKHDKDDRNSPEAIERRDCAASQSWWQRRSASRTRR